MYGFREKNKHYQDMTNPEHANADLELLKKHLPNSQIVRTASNNPTRSHKEILWNLLDHCSAEDIRQNRRILSAISETTETNVPVVTLDTDAEGSEAEVITGQQEENVQTETTETNVPVVTLDTDAEGSEAVSKKKGTPSKKKPSSRPSTGKTSSTKTSKTQR